MLHQLTAEKRALTGDRTVIHCPRQEIPPSLGGSWRSSHSCSYENGNVNNTEQGVKAQLTADERNIIQVPKSNIFSLKGLINLVCLNLHEVTQLIFEASQCCQ